MLPEVETFIAASDRATQEYESAYKKLRADFEGTWGDERAPFYVKDTELSAALTKASADNWNELKKSTDPLVKFIAENCFNHQGEATEVLKMLPATLEQLEELAENNDWCGVWNRYVDQACDAGVFGPKKALTAAQRELKSWLDNNYGMGYDSIRKVMRMVDRIVTEALAANAETTAEVDNEVDNEVSSES